MFTIHSLPLEVLEQIFLYLGVVQRSRISLVCKRWNEILEDSLLWHGATRGIPIQTNEVRKKERNFIRYRVVY